MAVMLVGLRPPLSPIHYNRSDLKHLLFIRFHHGQAKNEKERERLDLNIIYRMHAVERLFERNISEDAVEATVRRGKIIESYPDDKPYPSFLALGYEDDDPTKPLHVVFARHNDEIIVITAYRPDTLQWTNHFQTRLKK